MTLIVWSLCVMRDRRNKGSTDFVDVNERYVTNGFFYISVEDADKQSSYMGKNP